MGSTRRARRFPLLALAIFALPACPAAADDVSVHADKKRQAFAGLGAGAIFYEGHITSLAARGKTDRQRELYDDMFRRTRCRYLQLMIRHDHEPANDNGDPWTPAFQDGDFAYCEHTLAIARAARERQPGIEFLATLYTPPAWMKTNGQIGAGGKARATIRPGMELELAEYCWAFCAHLHRGGITIGYLSIANEPDWPHEQPGYCLSPDQYAALFVKVAEYFDDMARRHKEVPRPKLLAPNVLSAAGAAQQYLPRLWPKAERWLDVIGAHDYDRRADRWTLLRAAARNRPLWMTEWCQRDPDPSPGLMDSAIQYGKMIHEAIGGGVNAWMAYDWVYPPPRGGEALIHVDWGSDYRLTKIYHLFRQWSLVPWDSTVLQLEVKGKTMADAFLSADRRTMVVLALNPEPGSVELRLRVSGGFEAGRAGRQRTSPAEDCVEIPDVAVRGGLLSDALPARSLTTYRLERR